MDPDSCNFGFLDLSKKIAKIMKTHTKVNKNHQNISQDGDKKPVTEAGITKGLQIWREAVHNAINAAQLAMAFYILESSIAWDKSIMKVKVRLSECLSPLLVC